jgi:sarcosine oxidase, subunit gamma
LRLSVPITSTRKMPVSAPEVISDTVPATGVTIGLCRADVVELAALRGHGPGLQAIAARRGLALPPTGRLVATADTLALSVRPERWLLLATRATAGATAATWQALCAGTAAVVDQSSGLTALHLAGPDSRNVLARGCRLDLDPQMFHNGCAAATTTAQVATILAALPSGLLILTPASTARHLREWLAATARPYGLAPRTDLTVSALSGT